MTIPPRSAEARTKVEADELWAHLAGAGYVTPTWPTEYGGLGVPPNVGRAIGRALGRYKVPRFDNPVGVDLAGPAIMKWGTEDQKERFLRPIARNEEIWCQLFSEPGAGSRPGGPGDEGGARWRHLVRPGAEGVDESRPPWRRSACCSPAPIPTRPSIEGSPRSSCP